MKELSGTRVQPFSPKYLYDRHNRQYDIHIILQDVTSFSAIIYFEHIGVGRINWLIEDDNNFMELADIVIFDPSLINRPLWSKLIPFLKWSPPSFRQCGLGGAMLRYVIKQAEELGVDAITGYITSEDLRETPYLSAFYEKHGFIVYGDHRAIYRSVYRGT